MINDQEPDVSLPTVHELVRQYGTMMSGQIHRRAEEFRNGDYAPACGKSGSKIRLITDRNGLPLSLGVSGANMHDSLGLKPLVRGIPPIRSRRGPRRRRPAKLHDDKGYDYDPPPRWLRQRSIRHRTARKGIESSQRLGRHRWVVERTVSWPAGCRRLRRRYERKAEHFVAFVGIAAALIGYRRLAR